MQFQTGPADDRASITVTCPTRMGLLSEVDRRLRAHEGFALATLNLDHLVKLDGSAAFRRAYLAQDLVTADGNPVTWIARAAGQRVELLPGADLVLPLARLAAEAGRKVALVGTTDDSLARAAKALRQAAPGLQIAHLHAPPMGFDPDSETAEALLTGLGAAGIGLCYLALGAPKQEILAARGRVLAPGVGFASIGAGLDFLSGHQRRAPLWVRRMQMEWLWRAATQPRRLAMRYLRAGLVLPGHMLRAWRQRG